MNWFKKLNTAFKKSSSKITDNISQIFTKKKLDEESLEAFEDMLIESDMGITTAQKISQNLKKTRFGKDVSEEEIHNFLASEIESIVKKREKHLVLDFNNTPQVILMVGVNGSGKTTSIAKLCHTWKDQGKSILIAAADTFRAAAIDQLSTWADRLSIPIYKKSPGADAAGIVYEAYQQAKKDNTDILIIDTAGRLQNNSSLMAELEKISRVLKKLDPNLPHQSLLVLDGTTGQNALNQVQEFQKTVPITGLIMTKLDGTAKGGILVQIADQIDIPIYAIGVGESLEDLNQFDAKSYAESLVSTNN
ncbi:MAG: signal recognition particle-docking protein FtsY [Rickettsiales bacterium]|nr:signal recognition particle-docking protein FtsY [Rickettsiales bacterium]|tara:strand:+ start:9973 stop:10890 length:918 start_codon:yes stop_codon:yes gene_type:complete